MMDAGTQNTASLNIHQRMLAVMRDVSYVQKSDKQVNGQYRFVTHDAVTAKVRGAFLAHGIVATTDVVGHTQDGNRTEVDVLVEFVNVDNPADKVSVHAFGYGIDPQDKGPGKAVSYAVKYAYLKAFALETGDDPERDSIDHKPKDEAKEMAERLKGAGASGAAVCQAEYDKLSPEAQAVIRETASEVIALIREGSDLDALAVADGACPEQEDKMALASQLPSNVRSALKKARSAVLATQP